jgi:hypothetical protein
VTAPTRRRASRHRHILRPRLYEILVAASQGEIVREPQTFTYRRVGSGRACDASVYGLEDRGMLELQANGHVKVTMYGEVALQHEARLRQTTEEKKGEEPCSSS